LKEFTGAILKRVLTLLFLMLLLAACRSDDKTATIPPFATLPPEAAIPTPLPPTATLLPGVAALPRFDTLAPGWNRLIPGDPTLCAKGGEYAFWARQGASDNLLIYFEPGGACWDGNTCAQDNLFYKSVVDDRSDPNFQFGIFDLANPSNPFADYDMIYIPYCTGDIHWASYTRTYTAADGSALTIFHQGFTNASTVLSWVYASLPQPESLFMTGCSAGSPASILHAPYIIERYPGVPVAQLGDSFGYIFQRFLDPDTRRATVASLPTWIPGFATLNPDQLTLAQVYTGIAAHYPAVRFAQFNTAHDTIQQQYYQTLGGDPANWLFDLEASLTEIHTAAPNFYSYTAGGDDHCVLPRTEFYTLAANGIRFRDWLAEYVRSGSVDPAIHCTDCIQAEIVSP
jgi:hypothetical protein